MAQNLHEQPGFTIERDGVRRYNAKNERGGELVIGYGPGEFSPGDLLKIAILGCNALSSESRFVAALGEDVQITGAVVGHYLKEEDRFTSFDVNLSADLDALSPEEREKLLARVARAVDRYCTISTTVKASAETHLSVDGTAV